MFPNLRAEMARLNITTKDIAEKLNKTKDWVENRLNGKCSLSIDVAFQIWQEFFPELKLDYLFAQTVIVPCDAIQLPKTVNKTENGK